ncbi:MAG: hypothetical protein U0172_13995 [Nitrospiraceae bacterium]
MRTLFGGLLCLFVFMYVLGAPTTLWSPSTTSDAVEERLIEESLLGSSSIPSASVTVLFRHVSRLSFDLSLVFPDRLMDGGLFRPPCAG